MSKTVKIDLFEDDDVSEGKEYAGRFIGLIDAERFALLMAEPQKRRRLFSHKTMPLEDIVNVKSQNLEDKRLCVTIQSIDGVSVGGQQKIFVSEPINFMQQVSAGPAGYTLSFMGKMGSYIVVEEE